MSAATEAGAAPAHADNRPYVNLCDISGIVAVRLYRMPSAVNVALPGLFWNNIPQGFAPDVCWPWRGSIRKTDGYAVFGSGRYGTQYVHRLVWMHIHGPVPDGYEVDHECFDRACANPNPGHLRLLTLPENRAHRNPARFKTECPKGHPYSGDNLYLNPKTGKRYCRECMRAAVRRYRSERQAS